MQWQLTEADISLARQGVHYSIQDETYGELLARIERTIADAASAKMGRCIEAWVRRYPMAYAPEIADELAKLLEGQDAAQL